MTSYLPTTDSGLLEWSANFYSQVEALTDPTQVGLTSTNVTDYGNAQGAYDLAYTAAVDPSTRGVATVFAKKEAKKTLIALSRQFAMTVTNHPGVTDQQRLDFGLTVRDTEPTPVPIPSTSPVIELKAVIGHVVKLQLREAGTNKRGKPDGVAGAAVLSYVGDEPPADLALWKFEGNTMRTNTQVVFPSTVSPGSRIWLTSFWFNPKGESGMATEPVSTYLAGGLSEAA